MKIIMDAPEKVYSHSPNIDRDTTIYHTFDPQSLGGQIGVALDISGTVMDNTAYGGHGRTKGDVMQEAGQQDVVSRRNYMAIMSNTMSKEDFAKLQEEGVHPGNVEVDTVVTIVDHMKAAMVRGGTDVAGYTDDLDADQVEKITGNKVLAQELTRQFKLKNLPVTEENSKAAGKAWKKAEEITELSEGAIKYMVENKLPPTIENLYLAQFSGGSDAGKQGRGYYAQDTGGHPSKYYAQKAENFNWEAIESQMEKVINEAGYDSNENTLKDSRWLVEKGIPLTPENFTALHELTGLKLPQNAKKVGEAIAAAIADSRNPLTADLRDHRSYLEKALQYVKEMTEIHPETVDRVLSQKRPITLKNLMIAQRHITGFAQVQSDKFLSGSQFAQGQSGRSISGSRFAQGQSDQSAQDYRFIQEQNHVAGTEHMTREAITARRQLEEIRLKMTVEVNLKLLRTGMNIETAPLEQLVDRLREAEKAMQMQLTGAQEGEEAAFRFSLYRETVTKVNQISAMPAALIGRMAIVDPTDPATLNSIHESGVILKAAYEKAGETYEAVMTAPRKDLGDSIRKAFRNVDDILAERALEISESNRRAVRILGYNSMELSRENIEAVKEKDSLLQDVIGKMKPGTVLEMIREKVNPLTMSLEELSNYFSQLSQKESVADSLEDYSRFLYRLERKDGITPQERSVFIGVYRLFRQIEKGDGAVIGAMINAEMEFSMGNLLSAMRSGKKQGREIVVDDSFGGISAKPSDTDLKKNIEEILESLSSQDADETYSEEQIKEVRTLQNTEDAVIKALLDSHQPVTWNLLLAAGNMMKYPNMLFRKTDEYAKETGKDKEFKEEMENLYEKFTDKESAREACRQLQETVTDILVSAAENEQVKAVDVKELSMMCRQISLSAAFAWEEQYEIPVEIGGELTAVNLRIVHNAAEGGKVAITLAAEAIGKTACEFTVNGDTLTGYVTCAEKDGLDKLNQSEDVLNDMLLHMLNKDNQNKNIQDKNIQDKNIQDKNIQDKNIQDKNIQIGKISFIRSNKQDINLFSKEDISLRAPQEHDAKERISTRELYLAAKAFIGYIREIT